MRVWLAFALIACTSSDPSPARDASPATTCQLNAGQCVAATGQCCAQMGNLFDESRRCFTATPQVIGCAPKPVSPGSGCERLIGPGCALAKPGGTLLVWFTDARATGWQPDEKCSEALTAAVTSAGPCK
jgi:hypothetical protein